MERLVAERLPTQAPVWMFTAPNPGPKTLTGTHTYVVGEDPAFVIDPGPVDEPYQRLLADWLSGAATEQGRLRVHGILLTHGHPDHALGAPILKALLGARVWGSRWMAADVVRAAAVDQLYPPDWRFALQGDSLQVIPTPGHAPDHVALWMPRTRVLFAGDAVLGEGTTLVAPPEGDMLEYMQTLRRFQELGARFIAPGHGPLITDPETKLAEYVEHRRQRESQLLSALVQGPATVHELVTRIYTDVDPRLHGLAAGSVEAQLGKLAAEGLVQRVDDSFVLTPRGETAGRDLAQRYGA